MNPIDANKVLEIAQAIGKCDFRVTVSTYVNIEPSHWIITVGEGDWQRHLIVEKIHEDGDAFLLVLSRTQTDKFGYDINVQDVERRTTLSELTARGYVGVKDGLKPFKLAA